MSMGEVGFAEAGPRGACEGEAGGAFYGPARRSPNIRASVTMPADFFVNSGLWNQCGKSGS